MSQNPYLFPGDVKDNIAFGIPENERDWNMIESSLVKSSLYETYAELKERGGELRDRGSNLSGGQAQRMALARLFYADRNFVIIDEGTSELDHETEKAILDELLAADAGRTCLIVSHRVENLSRCDRIIWLDKGSVKKVGDPKTIIREFLDS